VPDAPRNLLSEIRARVPATAAFEERHHAATGRHTWEWQTAGRAITLTFYPQPSRLTPPDWRLTLIVDGIGTIDVPASIEYVRTLCWLGNPS
jgi:hypothetical protein